jgi:hypothetical protein
MIISVVDSVFKIASSLAAVYLHGYDFARDFEKFLEDHLSTCFRFLLSMSCSISSLYLLYFKKTRQSLSHQGMREILALQLHKTFNNELSLILVMSAS